MNSQLLDQAPRKPTEEKLVILYGISWERFKTIEAQLEDNQDVKLSYLSGVLEIMSPVGEEHEYIKRTLGLLLEAYMKEKGIRFYALGGFTLEAPGYASGTPDDSYSIGSKKEVPDLVIEIIITSGTLNRRELYKPKQVPEIWFWKSNQLRVFYLQEGEYQEVSRSSFFPDLDLALLRRYIGYPDQYDAVQDFQAAIQGEKG